MANKHAKAKNLRARALVSLVAIIVVVAVCAYLGLCGFGKGTMINYLKPWGDAISLGLDLRGGVYTVYQAENNGDPDFDTKMESTVSILTSRLTRQGFTEATVTRQGSDRIRVEIPNVSDPNQILTIIGTPAQLYFVDESGNNLMEGAMVKNAQAAQDQDGKPCIAFELTDEGAKIFAEATAANLGKTISITLDGETISRATVNTVIAGGKGEITGNFTADEAKNLATLILSGALPLNLTQLEVSAISATLGVEALDRAIQAGIIGVALVMLFMLFRYRLCGLVADIALTIYIMIVVLLLALTGAQLTLPGVAGIILGIGMAVDANVVIFERIREEVKNGRPIGSAVRKGFSNALVCHHRLECDDHHRRRRAVCLRHRLCARLRADAGHRRGDLSGHGCVRHPQAAGYLCRPGHQEPEALRVIRRGGMKHGYQSEKPPQALRSRFPSPL